MALTFTDLVTKAKFLAGVNDDATTTQLKQDINVGYAKFNAVISRYYQRKQAFTDLVAGQRYYQTPVDAIRVMNVTVTVSSGYQYPITQIRDEQQWREWLIIPDYRSNFITHYFVYGNDQIGLYPIPSTTVTNGLRYVYQPKDVDFSQDDYTTGTVTVTNGSTTVTGSGVAWTANMVGRQFTVTDGSDGNWYEILAVPNSTTLTLKSAVVGNTGSGKAYRLGQVAIFPPEYDDTPVDYALSRFFEARQNPQRADYHKKRFDEAMADALVKYSSSSTSSVITGEDPGLNLWRLPPMPGS